MVTYCPEIRALFSNDAFGQHIAAAERFSDELVYPGHVVRMMRAYIANILGPFQAEASLTLDVLKNYPLDYILTGHGCSWRGDAIQTAIHEYQLFASNAQMQKKLTIIY